MMLAYIIRRLLYAIPILIGVNLLTFALFFVVNSPDDMAASQLGAKYVTPEAIANWKSKNGYDKPLFVNDDASGIGADDRHHLLYQVGRSCSPLILVAPRAVAISPPICPPACGPAWRWPASFALGIWVNICVALMVVMFRGTALDRWAVFVFVSLMSISYLFYIIGGQYLVAKQWMLVPISGDPDFQPWKFLLLRCW